MPKSERTLVHLRSKALRFIHTIAVDRFQLFNGEEGQWDSIWTPPEITTCLVAAFTRDRRLVLVRMWRFPVQNYVVELPGGDSRPGETFEVAARRELLEETGYSTKERLTPLTDGYLFCGKSNAAFTVFLAENCERVQEPVLDPVERVADFQVFEADPKNIASHIEGGKGDKFDPPLAQALLVLHLRKHTYFM